MSKNGLTFKVQSETMTYGVVEAVIAEVLDVPPKMIGAMRARLRHLRNLGVPALPRPGSGKKIRYSYRQAFEMLTTVILEHGGFTPRLAISAAQDIWGTASEWQGDEDLYALLVTSSDVTGFGGEFVRGDRELLEALKKCGAAFFLNVSGLKRDFESALVRVGKT